jgi:phosphohistidine phosphatase
MKTIFLLRHAKAENAAPGSADVDRALNERGRQEAQAVGKAVKKRDVKVELVLCSSAVRARETEQLFIAAAEIAATVRSDERIYEASAQQLQQVISEVADDVTGLLLVGHNPALEDLIRALIGVGASLAPCTLAKVELEIDRWHSVIEGKGNLDWILSPKDLEHD